MKIVLLTAHSILEYVELSVLAGLGHEVLSIGAYLDPANPSDDKRPALPAIPPAPQELRDLVGDQMAVKSDLPDAVLDWADTVICHFFTIGAPHDRAGWLTGNWAKFKEHHNRVIWRTTGQSNHIVEYLTQPLRADGLEIVRYSPKERNIANFAGEDALIRFGMDPDEWHGWHGSDAVVGNVTQDMVGRGDACGYRFWQEATQGLPVMPAGPNSQKLRGGIGELPFSGLQSYLRTIRTYLYTGTQPAPYTLGLMEAMLTGVPVVSIGKQAWGDQELFEGSEITGLSSDAPGGAKALLVAFLNDHDFARAEGQRQRERAIELFGIERIAAQWAEFLR